MNKVFLHGRLTADVETKTSQSGKSISRFSVAEDDGFGENKHTNFHPCVAFGKTGENIAKYFGKGSSIVLVGRIKRDSYKKEGGDTVRTADIIVEGFDFVSDGKKKRTDKFLEGTGNFADKGTQNPLQGFQMVEDEDIPF